ncbi:transmembrane protein, putative (macronuclear) [Tetrahymena thermophila SB210]|uniref:Transmembrane protein, putative n=1 Tax=Tetrahymena thermophila (strain SB210) TaxID=312017 RepID=Q226L3_TETTS|nr:transmembrane protein, putative [Tetrahymena thermophila SB210]EAR81229.2 transmembrane protein, putative [Tetrahymena thermophila SB210]|eukprot:XP_001028892.2 transmembrane protein, putative [Tetrahymena thermophila SB210]
MTSIIIIITINALFIILLLVQKYQKQKQNPQLKAKIKRIFQEFLNLSEEQKYDLLLSGLKIQIGKNHKRLFKDQQINYTIKQNKLNDLATKNQQKLNSESDYFDKDNENSPNTVYTNKINQSPIFLQFEELNLVSNQKDKEDNSNKLIKLKQKYLAPVNQQNLNTECDYFDKDNENSPNNVYSSQINQSPSFLCNIKNRFKKLNITIDQKESQKDKEDNSNELIK